MSQPLMPKATAVWLVDNTTLTFDQIAAFCSMHPLEVQGVADGEVAVGIQGLDPVATGQLTREEIERCEKDASARLRQPEQPARMPERRSKGPRYTPLSKRQERPNVIAWLVRYHPELADAQIAKLVGTTKPTIQSIRDRSHWNVSNIQPQDPVTLGMCSQTELDTAVQKAQAKLERQKAREAKEREKRRAENLAAAEAAGMPSTQPAPEVPGETAPATDDVAPAEPAVEPQSEAQPEPEVQPQPEAEPEAPVAEPAGEAGSSGEPRPEDVFRSQ